jgi:enamine deaminase RidA (YjgF/YER057c/UK114 family)
MSEYPKYEKVNDTTIRIITTHSDEVALQKLIDTKKNLEEKKAQIVQTLKNIDDILENAAELGISSVPEETKENE